MMDSNYAIPETNGVSFRVEYVEIDGHKHRIACAGNPEGTPVIVMMGVFEDSLNHSRWLVSSMVNHPNGGNYHFVIVQYPSLRSTRR